MVNRLKELFKSQQVYTWAKRIYIVLLALVLLTVFYHAGYAHRIIPGVKIGPVFVGGMSYEEASKALGTYLEQNKDQPLTLKYGSLEHTIEPSVIDLTYDVQTSVSHAFEVGRTGNAFIDTRSKIASLVKSISSKASYSYNDSALSNEFSKIRGEINQTANDAAYILENGELVVIASSQGRKVSDQGMYDIVIGSFDNLDFEPKEIPVEIIEPTVLKTHLDKYYAQVQEIVAEPLAIKYENKTWTLTPSQKLDFVEVMESGIRLNRPKFDSYSELIAQEINQLPRGNVAQIENGIVTKFNVIEEGKELDKRKFVEDFEAALLDGSNEVIVSTVVIDSLDDTSKYGIFALLGEGSSTYVGSIPSRVHNLTLAAQRTNGVLVPPGEVYSFNNSIGEISGATGYDTAYIISNGRTVLGEGGGVCQTSTTLFRAVLDSGLPIVTRFPHAYRVSYYEQDMPVGFDASVYQPSLDFKFKNDTPNYILVESSWNTSESSLTFRIYGTPDGREVEITEPVVTNQVPPPEALYQDDPDLPKGTTKQVDWSAWGATVYFSRKVTRASEVLYEDTFRSVYQPWRAVYLVGTKE